MLVFIKVTDYNKIVKKDKSARRWSVAMTEKKHAIKPYPLGAHVEDGAIRFAYADILRLWNSFTSCLNSNAASSSAA